MQHAATLGDTEIVAYVADERHVSRSTQMPALSALLLLYREVLVVPVGDLRRVLRSSSPTRLPSVLTREDVRAVVSRLDGMARLIAVLLYGSGLRLMECLSLRVKDRDLAVGEIRVRRGKGGKDRVTVLPCCRRWRVWPWGDSWRVCGCATPRILTMARVVSRSPPHSGEKHPRGLPTSRGSASSPRRAVTAT